MSLPAKELSGKTLTIFATTATFFLDLLGVDATDPLELLKLAGFRGSRRIEDGLALSSVARFGEGGGRVLPLLVLEVVLL